MNDYQTEKWFDLYRTAMLELERAAMTGRSGDARAEIPIRLETLQLHPNLHHTELSAIGDALNDLRGWEREHRTSPLSEAVVDTRIFARQTSPQRSPNHWTHVSTKL